MTIRHLNGCGCSRRDFLRRGLCGIGVTAGLPVLLDRTSAALTAQALQGTSAEDHPERILVVVELSGGNDGLNTVVPFGDDEYYRVRPNLGIPSSKVIPIADGYGLHPSMAGFERLYKDGMLGVVHGCGYDNPSLSHFSSMGFWHTGVPNGGEPLGWLGRLADGVYDHDAQGNKIVNIGTRQSLAVQARRHQPLVFNDPRSFRRVGSETEKQAIERVAAEGAGKTRPGVPGVHRGQCGQERPVRPGRRRGVPHPGRLRDRRAVAAVATGGGADSRGDADAALLRLVSGQLV